MCILSKSVRFFSPRCSRSAKHAQSYTRTSRWPTPRYAICVTAWVLMVLTPDRGSCKTTFTLGDLAGGWNLHGLTSGYPGDFQSWVYGTMTCDASGVFTQLSTDRADDEASPVGGKFEITPDGIVTIPGGSGLGSSFHGVMRRNKDTMVLTGNDGGGGYFLVIYTRRLETCAVSDLKGAWVYHGLISNTESDTAPRWWHGSATMDERGNMSFDSPFVDSEGDVEIPRPGKFRMTEGGIVVPDSSHMAPYHGAMSQSKDMMVGVATVFVGYIEEADSDIPGDILYVWEKQVPGSYTMRDLAGTWYVHGLVSGSSYNDWTGWYHSTWFVDGQGKGDTVAGSYLNSHGETSQSASGAMSITSDGIITMSNAPTFHGIMSPGKDMWVGTMDDGGGGYGLVIAVGHDPVDEFDFNADGRVNFIDLAIFASHWLN